MTHRAAILAEAMAATNRSFRWRLKLRETRMLIYLFVLLCIAVWRFIPRPWQSVLMIEAPHHTIYSTAARQQTEDTAHAMELLYTAYSNRFQNLKEVQGDHPKLKVKLFKDRVGSREDRTFIGRDSIVFKRPDEDKVNRPARVFVVAGQSNAEGHNHIQQYHGGSGARWETMGIGRLCLDAGGTRRKYQPEDGGGLRKTLERFHSVCS